jgi:guanosine-3',5'-bis(diphosphate) 3'-pyrophosphohydrolase
MLAILANAITECESNIENIQVDERDSRHYVLLFTILIQDRIHLARILKKLRAIDIVTRVSRLKI